MASGGEGRDDSVMARPRTPLKDLETYPHKYVRLQQLSVYADVPIRTIYHHISKGALRAVKIGGRLRIPIQTARAYVSFFVQPNH